MEPPLEPYYVNHDGTALFREEIEFKDKDRRIEFFPFVDNYGDFCASVEVNNEYEKAGFYLTEEQTRAVVALLLRALKRYAGEGGEGDEFVVSVIRDLVK